MKITITADEARRLQDEWAIKVGPSAVGLTSWLVVQVSPFGCLPYDVRMSARDGAYEADVPDFAGWYACRVITAGLAVPAP